MLAGIREGRGTIGKLMNDDEMYARVNRITQEAEQVVRLTREGVSDARAAIAGLQGDLKSGEGPVQTVVADLRGTLASTRSAMSDLAENTEALKRNFLFRGYFEDRGYYDLNELTPGDYREGALAGKYRQPIRIWLRADRLMSPGTPAATGPTDVGARAASVAGKPVERGAPPTRSGDGGTASLSAEQSARSSKAMRSPIRATNAFCGRPIARARSASMLSGNTACRRITSPRCLSAAKPQGSPDGNQWDGVALALWVDRRAFDKSPAANGR